MPTLPAGPLIYQIALIIRNRVRQIQGNIKKKQLPAPRFTDEGKSINAPFTPSTTKDKNAPKSKNGIFEDNKGNQWKKGAPRGGADTFEWDVTLGSSTKDSLKRNNAITNDVNHLNISKKGISTH